MQQYVEAHVAEGHGDAVGAGVRLRRIGLGEEFLAQCRVLDRGADHAPDLVQEFRARDIVGIVGRLPEVGDDPEKRFGLLDRFLAGQAHPGVAKGFLSLAV